MSRDSILKIKSFDLSVRIVNTYKMIFQNNGTDFISKQIMRSGTAVAALIREAEFAESRKDFVHKLYIGLKEANETVYWLELSFATSMISEDIFESLILDATDIVRMLTASVKTIRQNQDQKS